MASFAAIDLSLLPAPALVQQPSYESILAAMLADLYARAPELEPLLESDPAMKVLQVAAYRETVLRAEFNDRARGDLLALSRGTDLDHLGALVNCLRLVITPADPAARPPVLQVNETDDDFRRRIQMAWEGLTTAGSEGGYIYHALSADSHVKGVAAAMTAPGQVQVTVLSRDGDGTASGALIATVTAALSTKEVRPLTDQVTVISAEIQTYVITAQVWVYPGPDAEVVRSSAAAAATAVAAQLHALGRDVSLSALYAALHQPGVQRAVLASPLADIVCDDTQAAYCTGVTVTLAGTAT